MSPISARTGRGAEQPVSVLADLEGDTMSSAMFLQDFGSGVSPPWSKYGLLWLLRGCDCMAGVVSLEGSLVGNWRGVAAQVLLLGSCLPLD